ncbi:hypothetical protein Hanom_Chr16g01454721 [Helianthus anomalus]
MKIHSLTLSSTKHICWCLWYVVWLNQLKGKVFYRIASTVSEKGKPNQMAWLRTECFG